MTQQAAPATVETTDVLSRLLADTYTLYLKTQNFHWNVTGPMFPALHAMFEEQYTQLANAADLVAERIRALGQPAPGTFLEFAKLAAVGEELGVPAAIEMVETLAKDHRIVVSTAREVAGVAEQADDIATVDLATQRIEVHEKTAWMLEATL